MTHLVFFPRLIHPISIFPFFILLALICFCVCLCNHGVPVDVDFAVVLVVVGAGPGLALLVRSVVGGVLAFSLLLSFSFAFFPDVRGVGIAGYVCLVYPHCVYSVTYPSSRSF